MEKNLELIGRGYSEEEKNKITEALNKWSEQSLKPIEGEEPKTEKEIKWIDTANALIEKELKSLGIEEYEPVEAARIHFLPKDIFKNETGTSSNGYSRATSDIIYINKDSESSPIERFSTVIHEMIHRTSRQKFYLNNESSLDAARVGYDIRSPWKKKEPARERLEGFNEIMVTMTTFKIISNNADRLSGLGFTKDDFKAMKLGYLQYSPIIEVQLKRISEMKNISIREVFLDLEHGQFENNILVLKDVEKACGKDSLEMLSLLGTIEDKDDKSKEARRKLDDMIKDYFLEKDEAKQNELKKEIREFHKEKVPASNDKDSQ